MLDRQVRPALNQAAADGAGAGAEQPRQLQAGLVDRFAPDTSAGGKRLAANISGADSANKLGELTLSGQEASARSFQVDARAGSTSRHARHFSQGKRLDQFINEMRHDCRRLRAAASGEPTATDVRQVTLTLPTARNPRACHDVTAGRAARNSSEQHRLEVATRRTLDAHRTLSGQEFVNGHERRMSGLVDIRADAQLAKINTIRQDMPSAARCEAEQVGNRNDGRVAGGHLERLADQGSSSARDQAPRFRIALVANRTGTALPNAARRCGRAQVLEAVPMQIKLVLGDGGQHCASEATGRRARVDVFSDRDDLAAGSFNAVPQLEQMRNRPRSARQVRNDKPAEITALNSSDRLSEHRTVPIAAAGVQLSGQDDHLVAARLSPTTDRRLLVFRRPEALAAATADMTNAHVPNPDRAHAGYHTDTGQTALIALQAPIARYQRGEQQ